MKDTYRYDKDPIWYDEKGFMWSDWLYERYCELNTIENKTLEQNIEIDMIFNASKKGRQALKNVEEKIKENIK